MIHHPHGMDPESKDWLGAPLSDELPPYDWGSEPEPRLLKVEYRAAQGLVIVGTSPED